MNKSLVLIMLFLSLFGVTHVLNTDSSASFITTTYASSPPQQAVETISPLPLNTNSEEVQKSNFEESIEFLKNNIRLLFILGVVFIIILIIIF